MQQHSDWCIEISNTVIYSATSLKNYLIDSDNCAYYFESEIN